MIPEVHLREHIHFAVAIRDRGLFIRFHYSYLIRVRHPLLRRQVTPGSPAAHFQMLEKLRGMLTYCTFHFLGLPAVIRDTHIIKAFNLLVNCPCYTLIWHQLYNGGGFFFIYIYIYQHWPLVHVRCSVPIIPCDMTWILQPLPKCHMWTGRFQWLTFSFSKFGWQFAF